MNRSDSTLSRRNLLRTTGSLAMAAAVASVSTALPGTSREAKAAPAPAEPVAGVYPFKIGEFQAYSISDGGGVNPNFPVYPTFTGPGATKAEVETLLESHFLPRNLAVGDINNLLVDTGKNRVLFDTGAAGLLGPKVGLLVKRLETAGIDPASIDTVALSHGHFDHIGGLVGEGGKLNFPNATFVMASDEWDFWTAADLGQRLSQAGVPDQLRQLLVPVATANLSAVRDRVRLIKPGADVVPGVTSIPTYGHTPGHTGFRVSSGDQDLINLVDVVHNYVTGMAHPEWTPIVDQDPVQAASTRKSLLDQLATDRTLALGYHFPFPGLGHVARKDGAYEWVQAPWVW